MVGHCYLMDGQGFPFLSKACYYYLCDQVDKALVFLTLDDLSESVKGIVLALQEAESPELLQLDELFDIMEHSGCDLPVKAETRAQIIHNVMVYDALQKRKLYFDSLGEGLEEFGVHSLMKAFPEEHKIGFTIPPITTPSDVLSILKAAHDLQGGDVLRVWSYLLQFITESTSDVLQAFIQEVTGLKVVQGNRIKVIIEERDDHIKTHTCSKEIVLSTRVEAFDTFKTAMLAVIGTENFTMV